MDQAPIDRFLGSFPMFFPIPPEQQDGCAWCGNNGIRAKPDPSVRVHQEFPENSGLELSPSHPRVPRAAERAPAPQAAPGGVNSLPKLVYYGTRCSKAPSRHPQGPTQTPLCASRGCFSKISPLLRSPYPWECVLGLPFAFLGPFPGATNPCGSTAGICWDQRRKTHTEVPFIPLRGPGNVQGVLGKGFCFPSRGC